MKICKVAGCDEGLDAKDLCSVHYARMRVTGTTKPGPKCGTPEERFWRRVDKSGPDGCWLWLGALRPDGYGTITWNGRQQAVHRFAQLTFNGPIPKGMHVDHICRVRPCVNPSHLQVVTPKLNVENFSAEEGRGVSGIRGVYAYRGGWVGSVGHNYRRFGSRKFATREEAAEWVLEARLRLHANNLLDRASA